MSDRRSEHWVGMPEFIQRDLTSYRKVIVHFRSDEDVGKFSELIGQKITLRQKALWYPYMPPRRYAGLLYTADRGKLPRYPVYIISKGRWNTRKTSKALEAIGVPYRIVVEPAEYKEYARVIREDRILQLPCNYSQAGRGSTPARNWVWGHAISEGWARHWILDDNIEQFNRLNRNLQVKVADGTIFRCAEDFCDRYTNVALAGFQYDFFAKAKTVLPPFYLNTRIYSCILVKNDLYYRWRGRYNEDTDLSLRALKDGWCTVLFYAFIQQKTQTLTMAGGNEGIYAKTDNRREFAEQLQRQHPDVVKIAWKFNRWQHQVNYRPFEKNSLEYRLGYAKPARRVDNYGMKRIRKGVST